MEELINNEDNNIGMIPCELCETMILFDDYEEHVTECMNNYTLRRNNNFNVLNNLMNILNSPELTDLNNNNEIRNPLEAEHISDNDVNDEYNDENEIRDENPGNVNNDIVNNIEVSSEEEDVVTDDNNDNENNEDVNEDVNIELPFLINTHPIEMAFRQLDRNVVTRNINWTTNIGRDLINNIEINIGNLHNLTNQNNYTEYEYNLFIQEIMGGDVNIGVKDFNKVIINVNSVELNDDDICSICFEKLNNINDENNNNEAVKTICNHYYCINCIFEWLQQHNNCPICNFKFEREESIDSDSDDDLPDLLPDL
jgi:hypothetical protein